MNLTLSIDEAVVKKVRKIAIETRNARDFRAGARRVLLHDHEAYPESAFGPGGGDGIAYRDALIVATAERAGCTQIFPEDLNPGQSYNGIVVQNPF